MPLNLGETVWGYTVLSPAESCGFGESYKVRNLRLNRLEVLRILPPLPSQEWEQRIRFLREAEILCRLTHPHIVALYDVAVADEHLLMALEYIAGTTLTKHRANATFPAPDAVRLICQVLSALEKAHVNSVVHRGISPETIVVTDGKQAKLSAFVFARMPSFKEITHRGKLLGHFHYTAPEQIQNPSSVDLRADIYSVAAVLYELLTGRPPFVGPDPFSVMQGHVHRSPAPPAALRGDIPERLSNTVLKALEKNPGNRHQTAAEFRAELERFCPPGWSDRTENSQRQESRARTGESRGFDSHTRGRIQ